MSKTMRAAVIREFGKPLEIEDVPMPVPDDDQILVKMVATGVCHTDLHAAEGDWPVKPDLPLIAGHEGVGHVVALGKNVRHVKEGDRVGVPLVNTACGYCVHCVGGWETLCDKQERTGFTVAGSFADYSLADPRYVAHIPDGVDSFEVAPILCAGVTVYKGLKVLGAKPGNWVAISGIGGLGHLAVQYAKAMGLNVAAIDVDDNKLKLAQRLGATMTVNARNTDPAEYFQKELEGLHGVLVTAVSEKAFEQAMGTVRAGATITLNGLPPGDFRLPIFSTVVRAITVRGSIVGTRLDLREALGFVARGQVKTTIETEKLENINHIFQRMHKGEIEGRVVLDMTC